MASSLVIRTVSPQALSRPSKWVPYPGANGAPALDNIALPVIKGSGGIAASSRPSSQGRDTPGTPILLLPAKVGTVRFRDSSPFAAQTPPGTPSAGPARAAVVTQSAIAGAAIAAVNNAAATSFLRIPSSHSYLVRTTL
jgi:hypothetical protein